MSTDFDPHHRELCPDGGCIGLIGPDGRCKECGTISPGAVSDPRRASFDPEREDEAVDDEDDRELCPDGACVGLIGPDGRCKECGTPAREGAVADQGDEGDASEREAADSDSESEFEARELCPDGGCIGLIGSDGRCKVCGTKAESATA